MITKDKRNSIIVKAWYGGALVLMIIFLMFLFFENVSFNVLIAFLGLVIMMCLVLITINWTLNKQDKVNSMNDINKIIITDIDRRKYLKWKISISAMCCLFPVGLWVLIWISGPVIPMVIIGIIGTIGLIILNVAFVYYWDELIKADIHKENRNKIFGLTNNK